ncbi:MAG: hypothetical protein ACYCR7_06895 [Thermoplasmataceae archaeon]
MGNDEIREEGISRILLSKSQDFYGKDRLKYLLCYSLARDNRFLESAVFLNAKTVDPFVLALYQEILSLYPDAKENIRAFENSFYSEVFVEVRKIAINLLSKIN